MKKQVVNERLDIRMTGRLMVGKLPPRSQQFAEHYYGRLPGKI
jgi:glutamine synthetase type III